MPGLAFVCTPIWLAFASAETTWPFAIHPPVQQPNLAGMLNSHGSLLEIFWWHSEQDHIRRAESLFRQGGFLHAPGSQTEFTSSSALLR